MTDVSRDFPARLLTEPDRVGSRTVSKRDRICTKKISGFSTAVRVSSSKVVRIGGKRSLGTFNKWHKASGVSASCNTVDSLKYGLGFRVRDGTMR